MREEELQALLKKYVAGQCTDHEKALLETWFLKEGFNDVPEIGEKEREEDLSLVGARLTAEIAKPNQLRLQHFIAAAVVLLVSSFALILYFKKPPVLIATPVSTYANDVPSGKNQAFLTLGNGTRVSLNTAANGTIKEDGAVITKTGDGQLVYHAGVKETGNRQPLPNTIETPQGGQWQVNLPDGTKVWLNSATKLTYPSTFAGLKSRRVELKGEAYFEVAHDKSKPFLIVTNKQVAEVLGTHFNINSYGDEPAIKTTLLEGAIKVTVNQNSEVLKPGQEAEVMERIKVKSVDAENAIAWKNGDFNFGQNDFRTTMRQLARWYNVEIVYDHTAPREVKLQGWISRSKNIVAVLKVMELTGEVHFNVKGRRILVTK